MNFSNQALWLNLFKIEPSFVFYYFLFNFMEREKQHCRKRSLS